jgi:hypothetical protein
VQNPSGCASRPHPPAPRSFFHFVFASIGIEDEVAHVGDVHYMMQFIAIVSQRAAQYIHEDIGAQIADMGIVIVRLAAGIKPVPRRFERLKFAQAPGKSVKKA